MYLVVFSHTLDDLPIGLCRTKASAIKLAMNVDECERRQQEAADVLLNDNGSEPLQVSVVKLDKSGLPIEMEVVRDL